MPIVHSTQVNSTTYPNDPSKPVSTTAWNEEHAVNGQLDLPMVESPDMPPADHVGIFGRKLAGRMLPAFIGPSGLDSSLQPLIARNKIAWANPVGNSTAVNTMGIALSASGATTNANVATTNIHTAIKRIEYAVTTAATSAVAGWRSTAAQYHIGSPSSIYGGFFFVCRFGRARGADANATLRGFTGFTSATTAPGALVEPSSGDANIIGVGCDSTDTNYHIMHRSGTSSATKIDTGIPKAVADNTEMYDLIMFTSPSSNDITVRFVRLSDNISFQTVITDNKPTDTQLLAPRGWYSVGGTSSVIGYSLASLYIETDY